MATSPTLTGLPDTVRAQILRHTGLVQYNQHIALIPQNMSIRRGKSLHMWNVPALANSTPMLLINHQLYVDTMKILFGENTFYIFYPIRSENRILSNLRPRTFGFLRRLHLILDASYLEAIGLSIGGVLSPQQTFFELHNRNEKQRVVEVLANMELRDSWLQIVQAFQRFQMDLCHLGMTLDLSLIPHEIATVILADLNRLPHIDQLNMRVPERLAQHTILQHKFRMKERRLVHCRTQKISPEASLFPWDKLMNVREIFSNVLSFAGITNFEHDLIFADIHTRGVVCCGSCSTAFSDCYCSTRPNCFSSSCTCWTPKPLLSILLTNHWVYEEATSVFFTTNRFVVKDKFPLVHSQLMQLTPINLRRTHTLILELRDLGTESEWIQFFDLLQHSCHPQLRLKIRLDRRFFDYQGLHESMFFHFLYRLLGQKNYAGPYKIALLASWYKNPAKPEDGPRVREEKELWTGGRTYVEEDKEGAVVNGKTEVEA